MERVATSVRRRKWSRRSRSLGERLRRQQVRFLLTADICCGQSRYGLNALVAMNVGSNLSRGWSGHLSS